MNNSVRTTFIKDKLSNLLFVASLLLPLMTARVVVAQSTDIEFPTPVRSHEISGTITPRDIGDPRLTRHFYTFTGTPGDLIIAVESSNLNGDVDLFTANTLRPLGKVSMYGGGSATRATKSVYLRQRVPLILRVEARSPNENEGSYRIRFEGGFEPVRGETPLPEGVTSIPQVGSRTDKNVRRVTSVGGRIEEPEPTVSAKPYQPESASAPVVVADTDEAPAPPPARTATARTARNRQPSRARTRTARPNPEPVENNTAPTTESTTTEPAEKSVASKTEPPAVRSTSRRASPRAARRASRVEAAPPQPEAPSSQPAINPRLIIETRDGIRVERFMSAVRRVTVENGQVVVISKEGKVERLPLANVLRMSIEP